MMFGHDVFVGVTPILSDYGDPAPLSPPTTMPIDLHAFEKAIKRAIPVTHLEIEDQSSGCGENYAIILVSEVRCPRGSHCHRRTMVTDAFFF